MNKNIIKKAASLLTCAALVLSSGVSAFATVEADGNTGADTENTIAVTAEEGTSDASVGTSDSDNGGSVEAEPAKDFDSLKDVKGHWGYDALKRAYEDGIIKGFEDETMRPDSIITGAQMVTIITRILNPGNSGESGLDDSCWYKEAAEGAMSLGIISSSDIAGLNDGMKRSGACAMMADAFQITQAGADWTKAEAYSDFSSLPKSQRVIFASLVNEGYLQGYNGSLMLNNNITRAEFVTLLYRVAADYLEDEDIDSYSELEENTVVSGSDISIKDERIDKKVWFDCTTTSVTLDKVTASEIIIRSDELKKLDIGNSDIGRMVIAAGSSDISLDCGSILQTAVGQGTGDVTLSPSGKNVDVTGNNRNVSLRTSTGTLAVSGNNNTITIPKTANVKRIVIYGTGNRVKVDSVVTAMEIYGADNVISGDGRADNVFLGTKKSSVNIEQGSTETKFDDGISGMTAAISAPSKLTVNQYLNASLTLNGAPSGKTVEVTWTLDGKDAYKENVDLGAKTPTLSYWIEYKAGMADSVKVGCKITYITEDGDAQTVTAQDVTVSLDKSAVENDSSLSTASNTNVVTKYAGNNTRQWAINHDYSVAVKEAFVNNGGYSSTSKYLVWVNIGTQHTMVYLGSKGNWKLIRSCLVSTGIKDNTPRGVWKTTYKQTNWTTSEYTVKPIVRFYGGGFAFHSRLLYPNTSTYQPGYSNDLGYPLSHGCVRMNLEDIQWLYDYIPNGTTVVVY